MIVESNSLPRFPSMPASAARTSASTASAVASNHRLVAATSVTGESVRPGWPPEEFLTVDGIYNWIESERYAHGIDASFDPATGVPATVSIDPRQDTADDERTVTVTNFQPTR